MSGLVVKRFVVAATAALVVLAGMASALSPPAPPAPDPWFYIDVSFSDDPNDTSSHLWRYHIPGLTFISTDVLNGKTLYAHLGCQGSKCPELPVVDCELVSWYVRLSNTGDNQIMNWRNGCSVVYPPPFDVKIITVGVRYPLPDFNTTAHNGTIHPYTPTPIAQGSVPGAATPFSMSLYPSSGGRSTITYTLPVAGTFSLTLYDLQGRQITSSPARHHEAGRHNFTFRTPQNSYIAEAVIGGENGETKIRGQVSAR